MSYNPNADGASLKMSGSTSGLLSNYASAITTSYSLVWPAAQGTGSLINDGSGNLSWEGSAGTVTSVAMTVPSFLSVSGSPITGSETFAVTLSGTALPIANGGTGQTTAIASFNSLAPATSTGGLIYGTATNTYSNLSIGSAGQVLTVSGGVPTWASPATSGTVTSVSVVSANGFAGTVATATSTPAITLSTTITGILYGNGTSIAAAVAGNFPTLNQSTTGTAANITATSNSTLTTLSALTTASSLASVGTITSGTWNATTIAIAHGGTGQTTAAAAFNALAPATSTGGLIYGSATNTYSNLAIGSTGNILTIAGGIPTWAAPATSGTVTSVSVVNSNGFSGSVATSTTTPAISITTTITGILQGNGTAISAASTTGSGNVVLATSPTLVTPLLGTPTSGNLINATGYTTANLSGDISLTSQVSGILPIANGGTDNGSLAVTAGGVFYSDGTKFQNVGAGTSGQVLTSNGASAPSWATVSGSYVAPTVHTFSSGSGTYTVPTSPSPLYLKIRAVGGGGAGGGSSASGHNDGGTGSTGNVTTFSVHSGAAIITCNGGTGGEGFNGGPNGAGGTAVVASSSTIIQVTAVTGGDGTCAIIGNGSGNIAPCGGIGGSSAFGGAGSGGIGTGTGTPNASAGKPNTGGGGGGAGGPSDGFGAAGGGSGGYAEVIITSPSASYDYVVGAATGISTGGTGGYSGAGGGSGVIIVEEFYQ